MKTRLAICFRHGNQVVAIGCGSHLLVEIVTAMADLTPGALVRRASSVADRILSAADVASDGSLTWHRGYGVDLGPVPDAGVFNGRIGEALFFSALHSATGDAALADAALKTISALRVKAADPAFVGELPRRIGFGLTGVGSMIYALVRMSGFLGREELLVDAARLAKGITPPALEEDRKLDVFWGASGAILGLLALGDATGDAGCVERARWCAAHLLRRRSVDEISGLQAWATLEPVPWTGFAHGTSGIAHALVQLYRSTGEEALYDAAVEGFAFEHALFRDDVMDWPDSRQTLRERRLLSSWCHGAPGIALARLSILHVVEEGHAEMILEDLDRALTTTSQTPVRTPDHLCCGNFGRIDILLEAGRQLENESLVRQAHTVTGVCLDQVDGRDFAIGGSDDAPQMRPGLWQGLAGIGYELLRLSDPGRFPSLLLLA